MALGTNDCLILTKPHTLQSISPHSALTKNCMFFLLNQWSQWTYSRKKKLAFCFKERRTDKRPSFITIIPLAPSAQILPQCAVVLSAFNAKREKPWCDGVRTSGVVCDVFQSEQLLWMHPPASPLSFNGPINWNWGDLSKCKRSFSLLYAWFTDCIYGMH